MILQRGVLSKFIIDYSDFDEGLDYEIQIKGCDDTYALTFVTLVCDRVLFSITMPCDQPTGCFEYEILEDSIVVKEGFLFVYD